MKAQFQDLDQQHLVILVENSQRVSESANLSLRHCPYIVQTPYLKSYEIISVNLSLQVDTPVLVYHRHHSSNKKMGERPPTPEDY